MFSADSLIPSSDRNSHGSNSNGNGRFSAKEDTLVYQDQLRKLHQQKYKNGHDELLKDSSVDDNIKNINSYLFQQSKLSNQDIDKLKLATKSSLPYDKQRLKLAHNTFSDIFQIYRDYKPSVDGLHNYKSEQRIYHAGYDTKDNTANPIFSEKYLKQFLTLTDTELDEMKYSHSKVVENLPEAFPQGMYKGNGIVYVGGGAFNWLVMLSIKTLRYLGSELPVEVIIPKVEEYELDLCGRVFPALGAKCVLLPQVLGEQVIKEFTFKGYQYKALALLATSFENVLLLDSDNVPALRPDYLFDSEPFKSNGLICWPDFWKRATSPYFYDIAGIEVKPKRVRYGYHNYGIHEAGIINEDQSDDMDKVPLHDREGAIPDPTTESGQLIILKNKHAKSLLLALYYNLYGPSHYYPLFSQGSDGEGDKETFIAAAVVLGKPFYQVNKFLNAFGHFDLDRNFVGCGMGQYDPVEDYEILSSYEKTLSSQDKKFTSFEDANKELAKSSMDFAPLEPKVPRILFVHANFPKLNPIELKNKGRLFNKRGDRIRLYGEGMPKRIGYDFELVQWRSMFSLVCELKIEIDTFKNIARQEVCGEISEQLKFLEDSIDTLEH